MMQVVEVSSTNITFTVDTNPSSGQMPHGFTVQGVLPKAFVGGGDAVPPLGDG